MQPIFTVQYGEYAVANYLKEHIKGSSIFLPLSSQEKGIDLIISKFNGKETKIQTIQVKTSRTYFPKRSDTNICGYFWFNSFSIPENADWIIFVGIVPITFGKKLESTNIKWEAKMICMSRHEALNFMSNLVTKKGLPDSKFSFCFDINDDVFLSRGGPWTCYSKFKISQRLKEISQKLL